MVGKAKVHDGKVIDVVPSKHSSSFYTVVIQYKKGEEERTYSFILHEGDNKTHKLLNLLRISNVERLKGMTVGYLAAIKDDGKPALLMITDREHLEFYDIFTGKLLNYKKAKKKIEEMVFSEF